MDKYNPPQQGTGMQFFDIGCLVVAIFTALWLPLYLGLAGASKTLTKIANPTWENLHQNPTMVAFWQKLGYDPAKAHDVIQNRFNYTINWIELVLVAAILTIYFVFLFKASDAEYRDVIREKFGNGKQIP